MVMSYLNEYDFTLKFKLQNSDVNFDQLVEALGQRGCADALIGTGTPGSIAFDFTRAARSAFDAVLSALSDIKKVIPDAKLIEVAPDFVGLSDATPSRISPAGCGSGTKRINREQTC